MRLVPMIGALSCFGCAIGSVSWLFVATRVNDVEARLKSGHLTISVPSIRKRLAPEITFSAITDRPLFRPDRRPAPAPTNIQPTPLTPFIQPAPTGVLLGVLIGPDQRKAILRLNDNRSVIVAQNDLIADGWILQQVTPDHVVLGSGNSRIEWFFPVHATAGLPEPMLAPVQPPIRRRN